MPLYLQQDYTHNDLTFAMDNSVKAGTLHALVCRLTNHMSADSQYNGAFLMTYRTFTDANELLDQLKARYYLEPPPGLNGDDYTLWVEQKQKLVRARCVENVYCVVSF
jgi:son of sevenless-like protein